MLNFYEKGQSKRKSEKLLWKTSSFQKLKLLQVYWLNNNIVNIKSKYRSTNTRKDSNVKIENINPETHLKTRTIPYPYLRI